LAERARRRRKICRNWVKTLVFWLTLDSNPSPQVFNRDSIYRRCKRAILSTLWKNDSSWFSWEASQPLAQSVHLELPNLAAPGCELPEVATSGQWTDPFITFSTRPDHSPG
jgi:hypothetical protein